MTKTYILCQERSTGTGTTETTLNGGNDTPIPTGVTAVLDVIPYQVPTAAITAAQSSIQRVRHSSTAFGNVNIEPKRIIAPIIHGGVGAFTSGLHPALDAYPVNIPCIPNVQQSLTITGTPLVANTAAMAVGEWIYISDVGPPSGPVMYYDDSGVTAIGAATTTEVTGGTITVLGGKELKFARALLGIQTVTVSESIGGSARMDSTGFNTSLPCHVPVQPLIAAPTTAGMSVPRLNPWNYCIPFKPASTSVVNTYYRNVVSLTGNGRFIHNIGYTK